MRGQLNNNTDGVHPMSRPSWPNPLPIHESTSFFCDHKNKTLSTDISGLKSMLGRRISNGIRIRSSRTGAVSSWDLIKVHTNTDGDVTHWELRPTLKTWTQFPTLAEYRVLLFND